ncbi:MAG TPA: hypothetical protein PL060_06335, partial [bacterium]|nr:hypothetical protein [bacterium]
MTKGFSLISTIVSAIIIIIGISCVLMVLQNTEKLFSRATNFQDFSMAADILFDKIQEQYGHCTAVVPAKLEGQMAGFSNIYYRIYFKKVKENLYEVHIILTK